MVKMSNKQFNKMLEELPPDVRENLEQQYLVQNENEEQDVVVKINNLHRSLLNAARMTIEKADQIGELLVQQKRILEYGSFTKWIEGNLEFSVKTAQNYMRIYNNRDIIKNENVSCLSEAYKLLVEPKDIDEKSIITHSTISKDGLTDDLEPENKFEFTTDEESAHNSKETDYEGSGDENPIVLKPEDLTKPNLYSEIAYKIKTDDSIEDGYSCLVVDKNEFKAHLFIKLDSETIRRYSFYKGDIVDLCINEKKVAAVNHLKLYSESDTDVVKYQDYLDKVQEIEAAEEQRQKQIEDDKNFDMFKEVI